MYLAFYRDIKFETILNTSAGQIWSEMKNQSFLSVITVTLIHIMKELKLMPFLNMNLSLSANRSSQLVNELASKSSSLSAT